MEIAFGGGDPLLFPALLGKSGSVDLAKQLMEFDSTTCSSAYSSQPLSPTDELQGMMTGIRPDALSQALHQTAAQLQSAQYQDGLRRRSMDDALMSEFRTSYPQTASAPEFSRRCRVRVEEMTEEELRQRHEGRYAGATD
jgi:hypothetical protein